MAQALQMASGLLSAMKGKNPASMMKLLAVQNPNVKAALEMIQQNNGNAEAAFRNLAAENNIDPDMIISALRGIGIKG